MRLREALASACQTPGAMYSTNIEPNKITVSVDLPMMLQLSAEDAATLEANLHNAVELALSSFYPKTPRIQ